MNYKKLILTLLLGMVPSLCFADMGTGWEVLGYVFAAIFLISFGGLLGSIIFFYRTKHNRGSIHKSAILILIISVLSFLISIFWYQEMRYSNFPFVVFFPSLLSMALVCHRLALRANREQWFRFHFFVRSILILQLIALPLCSTVQSWQSSASHATMVFISIIQNRSANQLYLLPGLYLMVRQYVKQSQRCNFSALALQQLLYYSTVLAIVGSFVFRILADFNYPDTMLSLFFLGNFKWAVYDILLMPAISGTLVGSLAKMAFKIHQTRS